MCKLKIATTFSGGFGSLEFALKYENIDHETVFACEYMAAQRESYINNHGEPKHFFKDIIDLKGSNFRWQVDLLHQSPPCQSFSMAGGRGGLDDDRGGLMLEAIRVIAEVQPKMFIIENVKGLLSSNGGEDFRNIMREVRKVEGYSVQYGEMNAKNYGSPQNRERVFIVGFRAKCSEMPFPRQKKLDIFIKDILEDDVDEKYYLSEKTIKSFIAQSDKHKEVGNGFSFTPKTENDNVLNAITAKAGSRIDDNFLMQILHFCKGGQGERVYDTAGIAQSINANGGGLGAKTGLFAVAIRGRGKKGETKQTIEAGSKDFLNSITTVQKDSMVASKTAIRRLTPRECARAMGDFDDMFKFGSFKDTKLYLFIGNAIDISTMRALVVKMLGFSKTIKFNEPTAQKYEYTPQKCNLFED